MGNIDKIVIDGYEFVSGGGGVDYLALSISQDDFYEYSSDNFTKIVPYAFYFDFKITKLTSNTLVEIQHDAFIANAGYTMNLKEVVAPNLTTLGASAFQRCILLQKANYPLLTSIGQTAFAYCSALTTADIGLVSSLPQWVFADCSTLQSITLHSTNVCSLTNTNAIPATSQHHINIYVPANLIDSYKAATNWSSLYNNGYITFTAITE